MLPGTISPSHHLVAGGASLLHDLGVQRDGSARPGPEEAELGSAAHAARHSAKGGLFPIDILFTNSKLPFNDHRDGCAATSHA